MSNRLSGFVASALLVLLCGIGYVGLYNRTGEHLSERARTELLAVRDATGAFPATYASSSKVLGVLPGPTIAYSTSGDDCLIAFFPLPLGPRQELACLSGELRFGP